VGEFFELRFDQRLAAEVMDIVEVTQSLWPSFFERAKRNGEALKEVERQARAQSSRSLGAFLAGGFLLTSALVAIGSLPIGSCFIFLARFLMGFFM
jgi:hypothetical protein